MNKEYKEYILKNCPNFEKMPKWEQAHIIKANKIGFDIEQVFKYIENKNNGSGLNE